ncbi:MAG: type I methionyl aminopeptidase [Deltaproteobacteria bacterium]|nr:type I methionyl aminopeptidase [Deltaproteobacteria bacterium]
MIVLKSEEEIRKIRTAAKMVAEVLMVLEDKVKPGITTKELDRIAEEKIRRLGAKPAFKGYRGFQAALCTSINEEIVHGIPSQVRILKEGDIIGLDCGVIYEGYYGDAAKTFPVGRIDSESSMLLQVTEEALGKGVLEVKTGNRIGDIAAAIQAHAERHGYGVVRDFVGHGIGRQLHEEPQVPNFGQPHTGLRLSTGMVLALEPMFNLGTQEVKILEDGWTAVTADGKRSAHFEHTVALTPKGGEVLSTL